jgi:hypothetical protein
VLGTAVTGAMRIASDNPLGLRRHRGPPGRIPVEYLLPTPLYYKEFRITPEEEQELAPPREGPTFAVLPALTERSMGATVVGVF